MAPSTAFWYNICMPLYAKNRRAYFDYAIGEKLEAGIVLSGQEVKSVKSGHASLSGSYAKIHNGQASLINATIKPYAHASGLENYEPTQSRRLLLHKSEILKFDSRLSEKGLNLIPLEIYAKHGRIKILLGVGKSKKKIDKRETIKKREVEKKIARATRRIVA